MPAKNGNRSAEDVNTLHLLPQTLAILQLLDGGASEPEIMALFNDRERAEALIQFLKTSDLVIRSDRGLSASETGKNFLRAYCMT
jgi:hypothetical protein